MREAMNEFERATLRWAKLAVFMAALAALFICFQWYEMHSGAADTHTLAEAAKKEAEKAEMISASVAKAADQMERGANQSEASAQQVLPNPRPHWTRASPPPDWSKGLGWDLLFQICRNRFRLEKNLR